MWKMIEVKFSQSLKQFHPKDFTVDGISIDVSPKQPEKQ